MKLVFTIGHSTRSLEQFLDVLKAHGVQRVVDVRHFPSSHHNPQFNKDVLEKELPAQGIDYMWFGESLGGFRRGGYEEYVKTSEFEHGLLELERLAGEKHTAVMCAELLWFKCHRSRIAQKLFERGWRVIHIFDEKRVDEHRERSVKIKCDLPSEGKEDVPRLEC